MGDETEPAKGRWQPFKRFEGRIDGWRGFLMETAVIGIGVLLALGAEQLVEKWTWQSRVERAEVALTGEQQTIFVYMAENAVVEPCIEEQLARIADNLREGEDREPLEIHEDDFMPFVLRMPYRPFSDDAWIAQSASGVVSRMDYDRQQRTAEIYALARSYVQRQEQLFAHASRLLVTGEPVELDDATRAQVLQSIAEQRMAHALQEIVSAQTMAKIANLDRAPDGEIVDSILEGSSSTYRYCREDGFPLGDWRERMAAMRAPEPVD